MSRYFEIDGYWKDTKEVFSGYIVKETDEIGEDEDWIFIHGFSEVGLQYAVELGEHTIQDFVVTDYREVTLKQHNMKTLFDLDEVYADLEKVETMVGSNGYPSKLQWAYYCENKGEMEEVIEDLEYKGFEVEELFLCKKSGQQLWNRDRVPHRLVNLFHEDSQSYAVLIDTDSGEENIKLTIDSVLIGDDEEFREELGQDKIDEIVESFYKGIPLNKGVIKVFYDPEQDNRVDYIITDESTGYHDGDVTSYQMAFSVLQKEEEDEQD